MASARRKFVAVFLLAGLVTGCASVKVTKNPDDGDTGIRYYRPKPYLFVTPADPTGRMVNMKLMYLPDFNEEYSAHIRGKASIALKDGWNLVGVNTKEAPAEKEEPPAKIEPLALPPAVVSATNVPMGFYESVYAYNGPSKVLKGWRYIGMTMLGGGQGGPCHEPTHNPNCPGGEKGCMTGPLYGLVFFNGVMTFRQLDEIANNQLCPSFVNPVGGATPAPLETRSPGRVESEDVNRKPGVSTEPPLSPPIPSPTPPPGSANFTRPKVNKPLVAASPSPALKPLATTTIPARKPVAVTPSPIMKPLAASPSPALKPFVASPSPALKPLAPLPSQDARLIRTVTPSQLQP